MREGCLDEQAIDDAPPPSSHIQRSSSSLLSAPLFFHAYQYPSHLPPLPHCRLSSHCAPSTHLMLLQEGYHEGVDTELGPGIATQKRFHIDKRFPPWLRMIAPKSGSSLEEIAFNAFPRSVSFTLVSSSPTTNSRVPSPFSHHTSCPSPSSLPSLSLRPALNLSISAR